MALYPSTVLNDVEAINYLANATQQATTGSIVTSAATTLTLTAAQLINGFGNFTGGSTLTLTSPTAAAIVAAIQNCVVGSRFSFDLTNTNSGTLTWSFGSGVTGQNVTTVATNKGCSYRGYVTNATVGSEAVTFCQIPFAAA